MSVLIHVVPQNYFINTHADRDTFGHFPEQCTLLSGETSTPTPSPPVASFAFFSPNGHLKRERNKANIFHH